MTRMELIEKMRNVSMDDTRLFHEIIKAGADAGFWNKKSLAHEFGTSYPTAERWIDGRNAPHPAMRRGVYRTLIENLRLVEKILAVDPCSNADFWEILDKIALMQGGDREALAQMFTVTRPTIDLWLSGTTTPHPDVRPAMYKRMIEEIQNPP